MSISLSLHTSPSNIAKIMESGCLRSLYFHSVSDGEKEGNEGFLKKYYGLDLEQLRRNTAVKNRFRQDAGNQLEMDILTDRNIPEKLNITTYGVKGHYHPKAASNNDKVDLKNTLSLLVDLTDPDALQRKLGMDDLKYFYQLTFKATEEFKKQFRFDPMFDFNVSYPDLVMITREDGGVKLSIIDIKMAEHIRLKQKLQVTLYALLLDFMIKELSNSYDMHTVSVDLKVGYIWHRGKAEPTPFDMEEVLPYVNRYLKEDILSLTKTVRAFCETENADVTSLPELIPHRLCSRCEYCEYMDYCLEQSRQSDDYQRLPYLSPYGQRCLEELYARAHGDSPVSLSCEEIQTLLREQMQDPVIAESIRHNPALREYVKETNDEFMIDRYRKLLSMTAAFDYSQAAELAYAAEKGTFDPNVLSAFLTSLDRQKEQDRAFLQERLDKLQAQITQTSLPEDSPERRHLDSLCAYQKKKLDELGTVMALSRSLAEKLEKSKNPAKKPTEYLTAELAEELKQLSRRNLAPKVFVVRGRALSDFPKGTSDTVGLYLTAQKDELTNRMFALGYSCALPWGVTLPGSPQEVEAATAQGSPQRSAQPDGSEEDSNPSSETCILIADSEADLDRIEREFIEKLHALFLSIHEYNRTYLEAEYTDSLQNIARKLRLQCFVMDAYESDNLIEYLYDILERSGETLAEKIMDILSWLQDERMADQDQSRSSIICDYPFISLSQTVRRTFLLPTNIAYRFDDIANLFVAGRPFCKNTNYYSNYFNNSISAGFIREHWKDPSNEKFAVSKLETELRVRLMQESMIRDGILRELNTETAITGKKFLLSYAPVFSLPERNRYTHPLLSKLDFQNRYEELLTRLQMRNARIGDVGDLIADNVITPVRYLGFRQTVGQDYYGQPLECHDFEILDADAGMTIPDMGLTFSPATENALLEFVEHGNIVTTDGYWGKFSEGIEREDNILHITLEHKNTFLFEKRMLYYMFERYTNWTSPYITGGRLMPNSRSPFRGILKNIDERDAQDAGCLAEDVISLLDDPCSFVLQYRNRHTADTPLNRITADESLHYEETYFEHKFASSQQEAFLQFYNQNLSLVQGPPGTGKTNFIAMSILIYLIRQHEAGAAPQKIFITSNSHVAIENVLHKVAELVRFIKAKGVTFDVPLKIYQLEREGATIPDGIEAYEKERINSILTSTDAKENNIVIGATVWALEKAFQKDSLHFRTDVFDVAIIDEASQVRLIDSTIALAHVKKDGKILLVGDHEQLPPIIQGTYETNEEKPFTAGSVFQYFIDHDLHYRKEHGTSLYSKRLNEQFRMNGILSLYPSLQIYEGKYRPATNKIASQTLRLAPASTSAEIPDEGVLTEADIPALCDWLMDPEYPFVLCNIRSNREGSFLTANAKKNFEIELVKQLSDCCIHRLYRHQKDTDTDTVLYDDAEKFWHEGMFIISPHHEHINRLRDAVKALRREDLPEDRAAFGEYAFIDTVDKMQGQETEIALVSYGISDEEQALREKEFVFNRNRLNVSITRGKKKMILILTDVLTDKQLELMAEEDQQLIDSIAFMNGIKTFASEEKNATLSQSKKLIAQDGEIVVELYRKKMFSQ